jgi:hypothetical protein
MQLGNLPTEAKYKKELDYGIESTNKAWDFFR